MNEYQCARIFEILLELAPVSDREWIRKEYHNAFNIGDKTSVAFCVNALRGATGV